MTPITIVDASRGTLTITPPDKRAQPTGGFLHHGRLTATRDLLLQLMQPIVLLAIVNVPAGVLRI